MKPGFVPTKDVCDSLEIFTGWHAAKVEMCVAACADPCADTDIDASINLTIDSVHRLTRREKRLE